MLARCLTPRQRDVLALLERGYSNPEIAAALQISLDGAKWHVGEILGRLGFESRTEAARWSRRRAA
jgi:DNA-binding NarL/FixJ family response regulator